MQHSAPLFCTNERFCTGLALHRLKEPTRTFSTLVFSGSGTPLASCSIVTQIAKTEGKSMSVPLSVARFQLNSSSRQIVFAVAISCALLAGPAWANGPRAQALEAEAAFDRLLGNLLDDTGSRHTQKGVIANGLLAASSGAGSSGTSTGAMVALEGEKGNAAYFTVTTVLTAIPLGIMSFEHGKQAVQGVSKIRNSKSSPEFQYLKSYLGAEKAEELLYDILSGVPYEELKSAYFQSTAADAGQPDTARDPRVAARSDRSPPTSPAIQTAGDSREPKAGAAH